jgi:cytoskeleton protein RodZ
MSETVTDPVAEPVEMPDELRAPERPLAALARRREEMGLTLEDVAQQLKFAPRQIEALETADFAHLPTGTFARGMLRSYARLLKLDAAPMLAALGERFGAAPLPENAVVLREPVPFADGARRVNLPYILFSLGVLLVVGALAFEWMRDSGGAAKLAFVPAAQTPPASQTLVSSIAATPGIAAAETPAHAAPDPAPAGGRRRIGLSFARASWVEITDRTGHRLISQLNPAGSEQVLEGVPPFDVVVGNAQHVKLTYDGQPIDLMPYVKVEVARFALE